MVSTAYVRKQHRMEVHSVGKDGVPCNVCGKLFLGDRLGNRRRLAHEAYHQATDSKCEKEGNCGGSEHSGGADDDGKDVEMKDVAIGIPCPVCRKRFFSGEALQQYAEDEHPPSIEATGQYMITVFFRDQCFGNIAIFGNFENETFLELFDSYTDRDVLDESCSSEHW